MPDVQPGSRPLLTIAIPTYNRVEYLSELLANLAPQLAGQPRIELFIADNASQDRTPEIVQSFRAQGLNLTYDRSAENLGPDGNFLKCLQNATGTYVWILGDDDLLTPNALAQLVSLLEQEEPRGGFDLVYLSSYAFTGTHRLPVAKERQDALGRFAEEVTDGVYYAEKINALIVTISANLFNKDRLLATPHPPVESLNHTNLLQLGWLLPLIHTRCRVLYVWERLLAYRCQNSGGWNFWEVFGTRLNRIVRQYFAEEPALAQALMNGVVRFYMPGALLDARQAAAAGGQTFDLGPVFRELKAIFAGNWRFWAFLYPVFAAPLPVARVYGKVLVLVNRLTRAGQATFRHTFHRARQLHPDPPLQESSQ